MTVPATRCVLKTRTEDGVWSAVSTLEKVERWDWIRGRLEALGGAGAWTSLADFRRSLSKFMCRQSQSVSIHWRRSTRPSCSWRT